MPPRRARLALAAAPAFRPRRKRHMTQRFALLTLSAAIAACGVPEQKFHAARDAEDRALKAARDASERAAALERELQALKARQAQLEQARSSALADAEAQRQAAGQLEKSKQ